MKKDIISSVLILIVGIILLIIPEEIVDIVISVIGGLIIGFGVLMILDSNKKDNKVSITSGICITILGIIFIANPIVIASIVPLVFGIMLTIKAIIKLKTIKLIQNNKVLTNRALVINIILLILGVTLIFNPFKGLEALLRIIALFMIIYAVLDIIEYYMTKPKKVKVIK